MGLHASGKPKEVGHGNAKFGKHWLGRQCVGATEFRHGTICSIRVDSLLDGVNDPNELSTGFEPLDSRFVHFVRSISWRNYLDHKIGNYAARHVLAGVLHRQSVQPMKGNVRSTNAREFERKAAISGAGGRNPAEVPFFHVNADTHENSTGHKARQETWIWLPSVRFNEQVLLSLVERSGHCRLGTVKHGRQERPPSPLIISGNKAVINPTALVELREVAKLAPIRFTLPVSMIAAMIPLPS